MLVCVCACAICQDPDLHGLMIKESIAKIAKLWWYVTCYFFTNFVLLYRCFYPQTWRDWVFPVCGMFLPVLLNFRQVKLCPPLLHLTCLLPPTWREGRWRVEKSSSSWVEKSSSSLLLPLGAPGSLSTPDDLLLARFSLQNNPVWTIHDLGGNLVGQFSAKTLFSFHMTS